MKPNSEIRIVTEGDGSESFADALQRMTMSTLEGIRAECTVRAMVNTGEALSVRERRAPWWLRWLTPLRRRWDRRERARCDVCRGAYFAASARYATAASLAQESAERLASDRETPYKADANFADAITVGGKEWTP